MKLLKKIICGASAAIILVCGSGVTARAQAVFGLSGNQAIVTKTGHTELLGEITISVVSGTSVAGTVEVNIAPTRLTNDAASGVTVTFSGVGWAPGPSVPTVFADSGLVVVDIPAGGTAGDTLVVEGMRISVPESDTENLRATISASNNFFTQTEQDSIALVLGTEDALVVDEDADFTFSTRGSLLIDNLGEFEFKEGWAGALSEAGTLGQTESTEVIFEILGIPPGIKVTFPSTIDSAVSGAMLTGGPETFEASPFPQRLVYTFVDGVPSGDELVDRFRVTPDLELESGFLDGTALIRATIGPIGTAFPDDGFPDIRSFDEDLLPAVSLEGVIPEPLVFPISAVSEDNELTITNATIIGNSVAFRARDEDGNLIEGQSLVGETDRALDILETGTWKLTDLFGTAAGPDTIASVEAQPGLSGLVATLIGASGMGRYATAPIESGKRVFLPFDRSTGIDVPVLTAHNGGKSAIELALSLYDALGVTAGESVQVIEPLATLRLPLTTLFGLEAGALPFDGYVQAEAALEFRASLVNNPDGISDEIPGLVTFTRNRVVYPFFVFGGGWNTTASFFNTTPRSATIVLTAMGLDGAVLEGTNAVTQSFELGERLDFDLGELFGSGEVRVGYLDFQIRGTTPFSLPTIAGMIRLQTPDLSTVAPLPTDLEETLYLAPVAVSPVEYTGLVIFNASFDSTEVTVEVFNTQGLLVGEATLSLEGRGASVQLLRDLVGETIGTDGVLIKVSSSPGKVQVVSYRGTFEIDELLYLSSQPGP